MEESIKTIKIVTIISIISFIIAWFMGSELLKDYSQSYIIGVLLGNTTEYGVWNYWDRCAQRRYMLGLYIVYKKKNILLILSLT